MGTYKKDIVAFYVEDPENPIQPRIDGDFSFFEIQVNTKVKFCLKVIKASDPKATKENVYWVAQMHSKFKTNSWLGFKKVKTKNGKKSEHKIENDLPFHEFLNSLNKGTKHEHKFLENGKKNPDYRNFTITNTKEIGTNYLPANPYEDRFNKRDTKDGAYGDFSYIVDTLGEGIWLEGINYLPEFRSQGAFIIAVAEPQILSFCVEKRTIAEAKVKKNPIKTEDTTEVASELIYGDMLDLHLRLHNVLDYTAHVEIFCDDKSMNEKNIKKIILPKDKENPSMDYNLDIIDELKVDLRWAEKSDHDEGEDTEDSLKEFTLKLTLTPTKKSDENKAINATPDNRPTLTREVTFTINYKGDFSPDLQEKKYVTQIIKVKQPPLITQSYEQCKYTSLTLTIGDQKPFTLLKEEENGALTDECSDNKTAVYELVAGNVDNKTPVTIDIDADVSTCEDSTLRHQNNTFNIENIVPLEYKKGSGIWESIKNKNIFPEVQPYNQDGKITERQLKFYAAYPYQAWSEDTFLFKYLTWQIDPVELYIGVRSCRYERTPSIYIHPDMVWALHFNYGVKKEDILYFQNKEVGLVSGYANYMDYIKDAVLWIYEPFKEFFDYFFPKGNQEKLEELVEELGLDDDRTYARLGLHVGYDGDKEIDYTIITRYKAYMYYLIYQMVMISLAVDLLILWLTRGRALQGKALKLQRVLKKVKKTKERVEKATGLEFAILYPKINANAGIYRIPQEKGNIATIIEATIQAKPLIGLNVKYEYDFNEKKGVSLIDNNGKEHKIKKFKRLKELKASFSLRGEINTDINIKYNTYSGKFTTNENGVQQELEKGAILKNETAIKGTFEISGEGEFPVTFGSNPITLNFSISTNTNTGFREAKIFGVDDIGPFFQVQFTVDAFKVEIDTEVVLKKGRATLFDIKKAFLEIFGIETEEPDFPWMVWEEQKILLPKMYLFDPLRQYNDKIKQP
ncbi:hypothetical protein [Aquimarina sp. I32.4]|uniref:hypothetical protein n=1 Tax=Aquimarina sp. I32.4 TaxID=2053903 RepID=UPI000CDF2E14|nr:hypothetical protein [Aquimarina sp. I32.4]